MSFSNVRAGQAQGRGTYKSYYIDIASQTCRRQSLFSFTQEQRDMYNNHQCTFAFAIQMVQTIE